MTISMETSASPIDSAGADIIPAISTTTQDMLSLIRISVFLSVRDHSRALASTSIGRISTWPP